MVCAVNNSILILAIFTILVWKLPPSFLFIEHPRFDNDTAVWGGFLDWSLFLVFALSLEINYMLLTFSAVESMIRVRNPGKEEIEITDNPVLMVVIVLKTWSIFIFTVGILLSSCFHPYFHRSTGKEAETLFLKKIFCVFTQLGLGSAIVFWIAFLGAGWLWLLPVESNNRGTTSHPV